MAVHAGLPGAEADLGRGGSLGTRRAGTVGVDGQRVGMVIVGNSMDSRGCFA